jgi:hypothetical protein
LGKIINIFFGQFEKSYPSFEKLQNTSKKLKN